MPFPQYFTSKRADKISRVDFSVRHLHLEPVAVKAQYEAAASETVAIREINTGCGQNQILGTRFKSECTDELRKDQRARKTHKTTAVGDTRRTRGNKNKNQLHSRCPDQHLCQSQHTDKYRGFITRCKPQAGVKTA